MSSGSKALFLTIDLLLLFSVNGEVLTFEVTPLSLQNISLTFEHPYSESLATGMCFFLCLTLTLTYISHVQTWTVIGL